MMRRIDFRSDAPWKQRFRAGEIRCFGIASANPDRGWVLSDRGGTMQLYAWDVPTGELRQLTDKPTGIWQAWIAADGHYLYYFDDENGNELGHYMRIPFDGGEPVDLTPTLPPFLGQSLWLTADSSLIQITFQLFDIETWCDYKYCFLIRQYCNGALGKPSRTEGIYPYSCFTRDRAIALFNTADNPAENKYFYHQRFWSNHHLVVMDTQTHEVIADLCIEGTNLYPVRILEESQGLRVLLRISQTGQCVIWDVSTNHHISLSMPIYGGHLGFLDIYQDCLLFRHTFDAKQEFYIYNVTAQTLDQLNQPSGSLYSTIFRNGEIWTTHSDATHPSRIVALDRHTGQIRRTILASLPVPASQPWQSVVFPSLDGTPIQAWLARPLSDPPFSVILDVHGGPKSVTMERFDANCQAWVDHGFAWISINYRGSVTFGDAFASVIEGKAGQLEIDDMVAARNWLIEQGIAIPDAIIVTGASYGGYLTLLALGKHPDLWAGGIAEVAIGNLLLKSLDPNNIIKDWARRYFGHVSTYREASPVTYAAQIKAPVLVIQGKYDGRCPPEQMRHYEQTLLALGKDIQVHWFDNGHFQNDVELQIHYQTVMLRFAYRIFNKSMSIFTRVQLTQTPPGSKLAFWKTTLLSPLLGITRLRSWLSANR